MAYVVRAESVAQPGGLGVDAAAAACLAEQGAELGEGEPGRFARGGGGGQDGAGFGAHDAAAFALECRQEPGEVLAQVGAELVVGLGAVPDGVLLGAGQHRDGLGQLAVGGQRPVRGHVRAQDPGQHGGVQLVALAARDRVPFPVAGRGHRVDRVDRAAGAQGGHQQSPRRLDRDRDRVCRVIPPAGEEPQQRGQPGRVVADPLPGHDRPGRVHQGDVVVALRPVDSAENIQRCPPSLPVWGHAGHACSPIGGLEGSGIRLAVRDPGCPQAPGAPPGLDGPAPSQRDDPAGRPGHDHSYQHKPPAGRNWPGVSPLTPPPRQWPGTHPGAGPPAGKPTIHRKG